MLSRHSDEFIPSQRDRQDAQGAQPSFPHS